MAMKTLSMFWLFVCVVFVSCTSQEGNIGVSIQSLPGWEVYHSGADILRLRKQNSEAIIDLSSLPLGQGNAYTDFSSFYRQFSHVSLPSKVVEERDIVIDGVKGKRISFQGQRADSGVPTAGMRYLLEHEEKGYSFVYLDAGDQIAANRREAQTMIERIQFRP
jgi:hypothetical protein